MSPLWRDGARLLIGPARFEDLKLGDLVVYEDSQQLIAHRLIRRTQKDPGSFFQTKADISFVAEPWQARPRLIGRVLAAESKGRTQFFDRGMSLWLQRAAGLKALFQAIVFEGWNRLCKRRCAFSLSQETPAEERRIIWAKNTVMRRHLKECLAELRHAGIPVILLKGQALLAQGLVKPEKREMSDLDLLIAPDQVEQAVACLLGHGFRIHGPQGKSRMSLDDQLLLEHPQGTLIDLHWRLVTGGWRFREVIPVDYAGLWRRAVSLAVDGQETLVLSPEDQWLHLCLHLILSGGTGLKWWQDIAFLLQEQTLPVDWPALAKRAGEWRIKTVVWLVLDTLWQRWKIPVPAEMLKTFKPSMWKRWVLRCLLPGSLEESHKESRLRRHLRELLLMDRVGDQWRLLKCWVNPPRAWRILQLTERFTAPSP